MILQGFAAIMNPACMGLIIVGTIVGIIFGALPGLTATMAIALCPVSYTHLDVYKRQVWGGKV